MTMEDAMALTNRLLSQAQALGAVTAYLRMGEEGKEADPALRERIERIVDLLDARDALSGLSDQERSIVTSFARSYTRQALELMDEPFRPNSWTHSDATILQAQGAASAIVARLVAEAGLGGPNIRVLDIGTGVARLAIAFAGTFPRSTVVGLDPWEPAISLARGNVKDAGLEDRVTVHQLRVEEYEDGDGFDLVWFPSFFIPGAAIDGALRSVRGMLRPGGVVAMGVFERPDDPLAGAVDAMITVRSGGAVLEPVEAIAKMKAAGFTGAYETKRTWQAPLRLIVGEK
ncbi:MAG TPA: class I SAM-dependent methyltransferase [Gemmatimonadaceae bacterium]|nr:class I SAM-dependent methyltransferase [Gemmatimonadaceae bacterium]